MLTRHFLVYNRDMTKRFAKGDRVWVAVNTGSVRCCDTNGCFAATVLRVNRVTVTVRSAQGWESHRDPRDLETMRDDEVREYRAELESRGSAWV